MWMRTISSNELSASKPSVARPSRLDALRPALDDARDQRIGSQAGCARPRARRRSARNAAICSATVQHTPGMERLMRGPSASRASPAAWMRKPTAARGLAWVCTTVSGTGSVASIPASGSRMMPEKKPEAALFGLPGRTTMLGSRMPTPVAEAATGIVGEQQLADRFLRAIGGERREVEIIGNGRRKRRAENCNRGRVDKSGPVAVAVRADRLQQRPHAIEIDAIALFEIKLGFAGDDAGEMEDHIRPLRDRLRRLRRGGEISGPGVHRSGKARRLCGRHDIEQREPLNRLALSLPSVDQPFASACGRSCRPRLL